MICGTIPPGVHKTSHYFAEREMFVDLRGNVSIDERAVFGFGVRLISMSHTLDQGDPGPAVTRNLRIDGPSWIASFALVSASWVQAHSVVSAGAVVTGVIVPSYAMVQGNPAWIVARYDPQGKRWERLAEPVKPAQWGGRR